MMEGSNGIRPSKSQQRGYIWLTVLLLAAVVVLLVVARCGGERGEEADGELFAQQVESFCDSMQEAQRIEDSLHRSEYGQGRRQEWGQRRQDREPNGQAADTTRHRYVAKEREVLRFELNAADTTDLQQLRGIGPVFARRIVEYRQKLGGYVKLEQLKEVYGMTEELYDKIRPYLTVNAGGVRRMAVNSATINELKRHPYLDYYQAKAIVNYRKTGGNYGSVEDLAKVNLLDDSTLRKIAPYIEY